MNIRKNIDYSELFKQVDTVLELQLPQMNTCRAIGSLIAEHPEKGAAAAVAEYLRKTRTESKGFSPRNVRRMREFYLAYKDDPSTMKAAMEIGWTQNVVILEANLTANEKTWYIRAARQFGWSKLTLTAKIEEHAHEQINLDTGAKMCYTGADETVEAAYDESAFTCPGNICRSPMAEFVMKDMVENAGLPKEIRVSSAATTTEEIGNPVYPLAQRKLSEHGIDCEGKVARQMRYPGYEQYDLIIGIDQENLEDMRRICLGVLEGKIHLLMDYTDHPGDVAEPWYTRDFEATWRDIEEGCRGLLKQLQKRATGI